MLKETSHIVVSTADLRVEYDVVGPVCFQVNNRGNFASQFMKLSQEYRTEIAELKKNGQLVMGWGMEWGSFSAAQTPFDIAFFIAVEEIKKRALLLDADGVTCMRQDVDIDTSGSFCLQMYGTAVRFKERPTRYVEPPVVIEEPKIQRTDRMNREGMITCQQCGANNMRKRYNCHKCGAELPDGGHGEKGPLL